MAEFIHTALQSAYGEGAYTPEPVAHTTIPNPSPFQADIGALVYESIDIESEQPFRNQTAELFYKTARSLKQFHLQGICHGAVYSSIFIQIGSSLPIIRPPIGRAKSDSLESAIAYDLASLLLFFASELGSWATAQFLASEYPRSTISQILKFLKPLRDEYHSITTWQVEHVQDAVSTCLESTDEFEAPSLLARDLFFDP